MTLGRPVCWRGGASCWWATAGCVGTAAAGEPFSQGEPAADFSSLLSRPFVLIPQSTKGIEQGWEYVWKNISPGLLGTEQKEYVTAWLLHQFHRDKTASESSFWLFRKTNFLSRFELDKVILFFIQLPIIVMIIIIDELFWTSSLWSKLYFFLYHPFNSKFWPAFLINEEPPLTLFRINAFMSLIFSGYEWKTTFKSKSR